MSRTNDEPGARANEQTGPDAARQSTENYTRDQQAGQLHRSLSLLVDAAITVDDAVAEIDVFRFDRAARNLNCNIGTVQTLMLAWRSRYA